MEILGQTPVQTILFIVFYTITGVVPLLAALYLLLRRGNAFAPDTMPPLRLRRWTAAFFAVTALAHVWWLLFYIYSGDLHSVVYLVIVMVDCMLLFVTLAGMLLAMLQDRRRPVWPALVALIPFVTLGDADLENKKVWLCQAVALGCMLLFVLYVLAVDMVLIWFIHIIVLVLVGLLLWRVETLPLLAQNTAEPSPNPQHLTPTSTISTIDLEQIDRLLKEHCVATQLYLQHELSLQDLAQAIGTNRSYLSQYFSRKGITYNTYINNLRIDYFIKRYQELTAARQAVVAQELAYESGFSSYRTFSRAFTQRMGQSVTTWMGQSTE